VKDIQKSGGNDKKEKRLAPTFQVMKHDIIAINIRDAIFTKYMYSIFLSLLNTEGKAKQTEVN
jgi:hypothetical protein